MSESASGAGIRLFTGRIWHMLENPWRRAGAELDARGRGALAVEAEGKILACGDAADLLKQFPAAQRIDFGDRLMIPGFIDGHLHYPQLDIIGSHGETLLGWLERYTYPAEARLADDVIARPLAARLCHALLGAGVTCAAIFSSPHLRATRLLFEALRQSGLRAAAGKASMDRHAPAQLLTDPETDALEIESLIGEWHGREGRLWVALTPRYAASCSDAMLAAHGELRRRHPSVFVQTHLAETRDEVAWIQKLFPRDEDYLAVYQRHGLVGPRTLLAHCIHLDDGAIHRLAASGAAAVHCPTSNFFLGSGLARFAPMLAAGCRATIGSDIGAGTSLSPWRTLAAAYETGRLAEAPIGPEGLFWLATLGGAEAMGLDKEIGNFAPGKQADFQVIDWEGHELLRHRLDRAISPSEQLFALITMGDERLTRAVFIGGKEVYPNAAVDWTEA